MADPTEDTINDLVASYLRSKSLNTLTQFSARLPQARGKPDFELRGDVVLYGEGEWMSSYIKGYNQAVGFGDIQGASGYFLIGYPDELRKRVKALHLQQVEPKDLLSKTAFRGMLKTKNAPISLFHGLLEEIPGWLKKGLEGERQPQDPTEFVRLMGDFVETLTHYIPQKQEFDPSELFEHILATIPRGKGEIEAARRAAAYLLLNQIVFYRILQTSKRNQRTKKPAYDRIDPRNLKRPADLKKLYFDVVLKDDYQAIFNFDVSSLFPLRSLQYIRDVLNMIEHLEPEQFTRDLLGNIFHRLIPIEVRKPVAAYYTNPLAARLLAKLAIDRWEMTVSDFACGSGTLLMAAYDQKASLFGPSFSEEEHRQFITNDLTGIDIMPFAAHLAVVQLALRNPGFWTDEVRIAVYDSTMLRPMDFVSSLERVMPRGQTKLQHFGDTEEARRSLVRTGAVSPSGSGRGFSLQRTDVVIMNPPFTRKQHVTKEFRDMLTERFADYKDYANKEMNFYGYFILLGDRFLDKQGRLAMVLPASFLQEESTLDIRRYLSQSYTIEHIVLSGWRSAFSEDTSFREILFVAKKGKADQKCIITRLNVMPSEHNIELLASSLMNQRTQDNDSFEANEFSSRAVQQSVLARQLDWRSLVPGEETVLQFPNPDALSTLNAVVPKIIQGIRFHSASVATNSKNTLVSRERNVRTRLEWAVVGEDASSIEAQNQKTAAKVRIPKRVLLPATRSASGMTQIEPTTFFDFVVAGRFKDDAEFWDNPRPDSILRERIPHIHTRECYLTVAGYGNINLAANGTSLLAFVSRNPITPTWSLWSFKVPSYEKARLLALWWNSTYSLAHLIDIRTEVEGSTVKWRKDVLEQTLVLDESKISSDAAKELLGVYKEVRTVEFPSLLSQLRLEFAVRVKIDTAIAKALGWEKYAQISGLRPLYSSLVVKLDELRTMMQRS